MGNSTYDIENFRLTDGQLACLKELFGDRIDELSRIELLTVWLRLGKEGKHIHAAEMGRALGLSLSEGAAICFLAMEKLRYKGDDHSIMILAWRYEQLAQAQYDVRKFKECVVNYECALALWKKLNPSGDRFGIMLCYANCLLRLGKAKYCAGDYTRKEYEEAKHICEVIAESNSSETPRELLARAYYYMGQQMEYLSSSQEIYYMKARDLCLQCIRRDKDLECRRLLVDIYMSLADFHTCEVEEYIAWCERARMIGEQIVQRNNDLHDCTVLGSIYETIASRLFDDIENAEQPRYEMLEQYWNKAIELYKKVLIKEEDSDAQRGLMHCFSYLWALHTALGTVEKSEEEYQKEYDNLLIELKASRDASWEE